MIEAQLRGNKNLMNLRDGGTVYFQRMTMYQQRSVSKVLPKSFSYYFLLFQGQGKWLDLFDEIHSFGSIAQKVLKQNLSLKSYRTLGTFSFCCFKDR